MSKGALSHSKLLPSTCQIPAASRHWQDINVPSTLPKVRRQRWFIALQQKDVTFVASDPEMEENRMGRGTFGAWPQNLKESYSKASEVIRSDTAAGSSVLQNSDVPCRVTSHPWACFPLKSIIPQRLANWPGVGTNGVTRPEVTIMSVVALDGSPATLLPGTTWETSFSILLLPPDY